MLRTACVRALAGARSASLTSTSSKGVACGFVLDLRKATLAYDAARQAQAAPPDLRQLLGAYKDLSKFRLRRVPWRQPFGLPSRAPRRETPFLVLADSRRTSPSSEQRLCRLHRLRGLRPRQRRGDRLAEDGVDRLRHLRRLRRGEHPQPGAQRPPLSPPLAHAPHTPPRHPPSPSRRLAVPSLRCTRSTKTAS